MRTSSHEHVETFDARENASAASSRKSHRLRFGLIALLSLVVIIVVALIFLIRSWPFTREAVAQAIQETLSGKVQMQGFHSTFFPHPGCVIDDFTFRMNDHDSPPLITIKRLVIQGSYSKMFGAGKKLQQIRAEGLRLHAHPFGFKPRSGGRTNGTAKDSQIAIDEFVADGAVLEFASKDSEKDPLQFDVHQLTVNNVAPGKALSFRTVFGNPLPPGEIHAEGQFGPWRSDDPAKTPISGKYRFDHANLGVFKGIAGTLSSKDDFKGVLERIEVQDATDAPDFEVTKSGHRVHLVTQFHAFVNGTNGDTLLDPVIAHFGRTTVISRGSVAGSAGQKGKTTTLDMASNEGRIQDLMLLFIKAKRSPIAGPVRFKAKVMVPPGQQRFLEKVKFDGDFGISDAHFKPNMQAGINKLSERASGEKDVENPEDVISDLKGHVTLRNGIATFSNVTFSVPGALAHLNGTFNLLNERIDMHGTLAMQAELSQTTKGIKSFLLKALDPFFKKKHAGAVVPVKITGTYAQPSYGLSVTGK
jgi:hypothetical protein